MPEKLDKVLSWAVDLEDQAQEQALRAARLPFVAGYIALMPDAHWGMGATIGSVIPTMGAIVPSAVGVDIGCGMVAARLTCDIDIIKAYSTEILERIERNVPAGLGKWRSPEDRRDEAITRLDKAGLIDRHSVAAQDVAGRIKAPLTTKDINKIPDQLGTLGSGNHFIEICEDEDSRAWVVLHSGSRGVGNQVARWHIDRAKGVMKSYFIDLEDEDLAYLVEGTDAFEAYINDLLWAQQYALASREWMTDLIIESINDAVNEDYHKAYGDAAGTTSFRRVGADWIINCHHNYVELEHHHGKDLWITRKGAIRAREDDYGVIPGSMGTGAYVVKGKGNPASFTSAAHGAGRRMSRKRARTELSLDTLREKMGDRAWLADKAEALLDEHPDAYKSIEEVMHLQEDLVDPVHHLQTVINYKGTA